MEKFRDETSSNSLMPFVIAGGVAANETIRKNLQNITRNGVGVSFNTTIQWLNMTRLNEIFNYIENCNISFGAVIVSYQLTSTTHYD